MAVLGVLGAGLMTPAAIWYANEFPVTQENVPPALTYPPAILRWFNEQQALLENSDPVLKEGPVPVWSG